MSAVTSGMRSEGWSLSSVGWRKYAVGDCRRWACGRRWGVEHGGRERWCRDINRTGEAEAGYSVVTCLGVEGCSVPCAVRSRETGCSGGGCSGGAGGGRRGAAQCCGRLPGNGGPHRRSVSTSGVRAPGEGDRLGLRTRATERVVIAEPAGPSLGIAGFDVLPRGLSRWRLLSAGHRPTRCWICAPESGAVCGRPVAGQIVRWRSG